MSLSLKGDERELLHEEVDAFVAAIPDAQTRAAYQPLLDAIQRGEVPDAALDALGGILEVGLQTGRIRKIHRALGEQTLLRIYHKTPAGEAQTKGLVDLNAALAQLEGHTIETVRVIARVPGTYLAMISTDKCEMTLRFTPDDAGVESVALGV